MSDRETLVAAKFVQLVACQDGAFGETLYALDANGSVWRHGYEIAEGRHRHYWTRIPNEDRRV